MSIASPYIASCSCSQLDRIYYCARVRTALGIQRIKRVETPDSKHIPAPKRAAAGPMQPRPPGQERWAPSGARSPSRGLHGRR